MKKPLKPCNYIGCSKLTRKKYCEQHEYKTVYDTRFYDQYVRDKESTKFYKSKPWKKTREQVLIRDHGLCQSCLKNKRITMASIVDHIIPLKIAWEKRLDMNNLQSLCQSCHNQKTAEDKKKYGL
jgi:5-methylcytosine-specific restriction enzyme A